MKEELLLKQRIGNQRPFKVPEDYFESLEKGLIQNILEASVQNKRYTTMRGFMRPLKWVACFTAVFFVLGIIYFYNLDKSSSSINLANNISEKISPSIYADYILDEIYDYAMLDNDDIYSYVANE